MSTATESDYEAAIIGGGSAGYAAARILAAGGLRTALIDGAEELGGLCILRGCMPTKALLHSAEVLHLVQQSTTFGVHAGQVQRSFKEIMARKDRLIAEFAEYRRQQLQSGTFDLIRAQAHFRDPHTIVLSSGRALRARNFVISTGSKVAGCPLPPIERIGCLTSDDALKLKELPDSLIILGGGAVAVEFAQFFGRLGVKVTLIQRSDHVLRDMDTDMSSVLEEVFRREGITVFTGTRLLDAWKAGGVKGVEFEHGGKAVRVEAQEILFALGRVPNTDALHLEAAGIGVKQGRIITHPDMRTNVRHVYAAGDCTGLYEVVHLAVQQGEAAAHNILFPDRTRHMDYRLLTSVVFTDPPLATVGLTEKAARGLGIAFETASYPFADHGKSLILDAKDGFVKLLADPLTGEILGGGVVGPMGGELIHEVIVAMANGMTVQAFAALPHYHPTLAEIWTYPAEELAGRVADGPGGG
jgi:pyruvate/2-oxoglutarate dehydrogenase complex dihydrolipoamide dehydrogenase (E3) component